MPENREFFIGRQPIMDRNQNIVAYELLFRSGSTSDANVSDDMAASAHVITHAFTELGVAEVLGKFKGFVNVNASLLMSEMIELLPKEKVVIELLESIKVTPEVVERCKALKAMGFSLALDDYTGSDLQFNSLLGIVEVVKLDFPLIGMENLARVVQRLKHWPVKLLAEKIEDHAQMELCMKLGCDLFQGYYFAKPSVLAGKHLDPSRLAILRLLSLVLKDANIMDIEHVLQHDPSLTYKLLLLVNSVAMGLLQRIDSVHSALIMLGQRQLQHWLQLLIFVPNSGQTSNPLLQLAATRGKLMEQLTRMQAKYNNDYPDRAFTAGILSLLDTLLGMSMEEIIKHINLADDIEAALLKREGNLGNLLVIVEKLERNEFEPASAALYLPGITGIDLLNAQMEAMCWSNDLSEENKL